MCSSVSQCLALLFLDAELLCTANLASFLLQPGVLSPACLAELCGRRPLTLSLCWLPRRAVHVALALVNWCHAGVMKQNEMGHYSSSWPPVETSSF